MSDEYEAKKLKRAKRDVADGHTVTLYDRHGHAVQVRTPADLRQWVEKGFTP